VSIVRSFFTPISFDEVTTMYTRRYVSLLFLAFACAMPRSSRTSLQSAPADLQPDTFIVILAGAATAPAVTDGRPAMLAERRRHAALRGTVYDRDVLAKSGVRVSQFVRRVAGSYVANDGLESSRVVLRPCFGHAQAPAVFVDGSRAADAIATLDSFMSADLEMIEVYQGVAQLPPEVNGECSAVFLWTKRAE
jgi:hypothetical protein